MKQVLFYHFVTGSNGVKKVFTTAGLKPGMKLDTMYVSTSTKKPYQLSVGDRDGKIQIKSVGTTAYIVRSNVKCGAGFAHIINNVLVPMPLSSIPVSGRAGGMGCGMCLRRVVAARDCCGGGTRSGSSRRALWQQKAGQISSTSAEIHHRHCRRRRNTCSHPSAHALSSHTALLRGGDGRRWPARARRTAPRSSQQQAASAPLVPRVAAAASETPMPSVASLL